MSQPFKREAWDYIWAEMPAQDKDAVRSKARWEKVTLSAALKWMYPDAWQSVIELSEACA